MAQHCCYLSLVVLWLVQVVFTRQGLEPADAARLSQLVQESSGARTRPGGSRPQGGSNASTSVVPFAELSQPVRSACAAAVQQEVAALAVDAAADQEVLQAWDQEPLKQAELAAKQQDLSKAQGRLAQLQHLQAQEAQQAEVAAAAAEHPVGKQQVQQQAAAEGQQQPRPQQSQGTDAPAADAVEAAHAAAAAASVQEELLATLRMCQELCTSLAAEVHELEQLLARWQQLMQRHQQLAVMFRSEKHKLLVEVLEQLA